MIRKYIFRAVAVGCMGLAFAACNDDDLDPNSIFSTEGETLSVSSPTYQLDKFCEDSIRSKYNIKFIYKMDDMLSDQDYNLVPANYENSIDLVVLTKYLWLDVYAKVVDDKEFLQKYAPRILHLIGSKAFNAANQTETLGVAEGGLMITLYGVNQMADASFLANLSEMNKYFFLTMHHEFAHILHQTKTYPKTFETISKSYYDALQWQHKDERVTASLGFVSPYASSQPREDFAETIARYITMTKSDSLTLFSNAAKGWVVTSDNKVSGEAESDTDGVDGVAVLLQKIDIARQWFRDSWSMDLDALREEVQKRQNTYSVDLVKELRKQVTDIPLTNESGN